jgi:arylsulfatase A-like enzyme
MYQLPEFLGLEDQFDTTSWVAFKPLSPFIFNLLSGFGVSPFSFPILRHINYIYNNGTPSAYYDEPFTAASELIDVEREKPLFIWIHIWPPHWPNNPPPLFRGAYIPTPEVVGDLRGKTGLEYKRTLFRMRARYNESILFADYALKDFVDKLKQKGVYDNSIIIVSSDHGNTIDTDNTLVVSPMMEEQIFNVPLLIRLPGQRSGVRVDSLAEHVDMAPTILDLLGRDIPGWMEGESLIPYMKDPTLKSTKMKYSMSFVYGANNDPVRWFASFRDDYKLVYHLDSDTALLFNVNDSHSKENNLARRKYNLYREMRGDIKNRIDENYRIIGRDIEDIVSY